MKKLENLADIQNEFQDSIKNRTRSLALANIIIERAPVSVEERMSVYQDAYLIRMTESLRDDFTEFEMNLGSVEFDKLAHEFIRLTPSKHRNLAEYSQHFPVYLKRISHPLYEVAVKEWMLILSSHAPDPELDICASSTDIQNGVSFLVKKHPASIIKKNEVKSYLAYRPLDEVKFMEITNSEFDLLSFLHVGKSIEEITAEIANLNIRELELGEKISHWVTNQIIYCEKNL